MYAGFVMFGYMQIYLDINGSTIMTVLPGGWDLCMGPCSCTSSVLLVQSFICH